jgi:hypothetical protein
MEMWWQPFLYLHCQMLQGTFHEDENLIGHLIWQFDLLVALSAALTIASEFEGKKTVLYFCKLQVTEA